MSKHFCLDYVRFKYISKGLICIMGLHSLLLFTSNDERHKIYLCLWDMISWPTYKRGTCITMAWHCSHQTDPFDLTLPQCELLTSSSSSMEWRSHCGKEKCLKEGNCIISPQWGAYLHLCCRKKKPVKMIGLWFLLPLIVNMQAISQLGIDLPPASNVKLSRKLINYSVIN